MSDEQGAPGAEPTRDGKQDPESPLLAGPIGMRLTEGLPAWTKPLISLGVLAVGTLGFFLVWIGLGDFLTVLLLGWILAYLLDPVIDRFERLGWGRTGAIGVGLAVVLAVAALTILLVIPYLVGEIQQLAGRLDQYGESLQKAATRLEGWIKETTGRDAHLGIADFSRQLPALLGDLKLDAIDPVRSFVQKVLGGTFGALGAVFRWSLLPIFTFFFLRDFDRIKSGLYGLLPFRSRAIALDHYIRIDEKISRFIRGQAVVCLWLAVLYSFGLVAFTNIDLALFIGVMSGLLFIVPYLGTFLGIALGTLMAFLKFGVSLEILKVWAVFGVVQGLEGTVLTPKIVGDSVGLHPVVVMLALLIGGNLFGLMGVLLAVPMAAGLQVLLATAVEDFQATGWFQAGKDEAPPVDALP